VRLFGLAGSVRRGSLNRALIAAAREACPAGVSLDVGSIAGVPLYDGDVEASQGIPEPVRTLKDALAGSAGLLIVTPEYNNSIPGPLKNAIDWMSRPPKDIGRVFGGKPVALIGATPGRGGTRFAQVALLPVIRTLGMRPWFEQSLYVDSAEKMFEDGRLVDDDLRKRLSRFMGGFAEFARQAAGER
jgi:NAD(P)H-dependent FMN reductase